MEFEPKKFFINFTYITVIGVMLAFLLITYNLCRLEFLYLFATYDLIMLILYSAFIIVVAFLYKRIDSDAFLDFVRNNKHLIIIIMAVLLSFLHFYSYLGLPLSGDENCFLYQAKVFAQGKLYGSVPLELQARAFPRPIIPNFFEADSMGRIISRYWPGYSLLLAPFVFLGVPWLLNILLLVLTFYLVIKVSDKLFDDYPDASLWAFIFTVASPVLLVNTISYYPNIAYVFTSLLFLYLVFDRKPYKLFLAGLTGSFALVMHNPVPHAIFALPILISLIFEKNKVKNLFYIAMGYLPLMIFLGIGWYLLRSNVLSYMTIATHPLGKTVFEQMLLFKIDSYIPLARLIAFFKMWSWNIPGILILAFLGWKYGREHKYIKIFGYIVVFNVLLYFFVPFDQGNGWGYRYFAGNWIVIPLLAVAYMSELYNRNRNSYYTMVSVVTALVIVCVIVSVPVRMYQVRDHLSKHFGQRLDPIDDDPQIIFVPRKGRLTIDLVQNDPFLRNKALYLFSSGVAKDKVFMEEKFPHFKAMDSSTRIWKPQKITGEYSYLEKIIMKRWGNNE